MHSSFLPDIQADPERLLLELDLVDEAIAAAVPWLDALRHRQDQLITVLDTVTRPVPMPAPSRTIYRGVAFRGEIVSLSAFIEIHLYVLRRLWNEFPEQRGAMAQAMTHRGSSRRYVCQDREHLFVGKSKEWVLRHSVRLVEVPPEFRLPTVAG